MLMDFYGIMKISILILTVFISASVFAQPDVSVRTSPLVDSVILLPTNSITLTGTAVQANPGHPILDTTWTKTSGPAATIVNPSNRMNTKVTGLVKGTYVFTLTASDKNNSVSTTLKVTVISGVLPIDLAYLNVSKNDHGTLITWGTDMEENFSHFTIQKSANGSAFYDIATITSQTKEGNSSTPLTYSYQISIGSTQADMHNIVLAMTLLAAIVLIGKLKKLYKGLVIAVICMFLFSSCSKSVTTPDNAPTSSSTAYRLKLVDKDNHVNYSEIKVVN
jgi:hypothetical protein